MATNKVKSPNDKGHGFLWALLAVIVIVVVVIGFVVMKTNAGSKGDKAPVATESTDFDLKSSADEVQLVSAKANEKTPVVDLYEDMSCPHCAELAEATDDAMKTAIEEGKLKVNIRTLHFLDRGNKDGFSTEALAALYTVAQAGDAQTYWNLRKSIFEQQAKIFGKWGNGDFADLAKELGADDDTVKKIRDGANLEAANKEGDTNAKKLEKEGDGTVSSPRIFVDGKEYKLKADEKGEIVNWVPEVTEGTAELVEK